MDSDITFLGIPLSTHRQRGAYFLYEQPIAAISILFFRTTVHQTREHWILRWFFAILLAGLAYSKRSYELISAVEIFSYTVTYIMTQNVPRISKLLLMAGAAIASISLAHALTTGMIGEVFSVLTPSFIVHFLERLFPIIEMKDAYRIMRAFADPIALQTQIHHLFFITVHIQVGMGFLGIDFLRREQHRRNILIRMDIEPTEEERAALKNDTEAIKAQRAKNFQKGAAPFILLTAFPYMLQIIAYGNINKFAFSCLQHEMHRVVRVNQVFEHENNLIAVASDATSPEAYAGSMDKVISTAYDIWNRKLFSLPKVLLLPGVMARQPMLIVTVFPFIFVSDYIKAGIESFLTTKIESLQKQIQENSAIRSKVESFDIKNAELLQRSGRGATDFTLRRWEELTVKVQKRRVVSDLLSRSKGFFSFIQRNFVFSVLVDCALANLIAIGRINAAEVFVFSRAIEDAVDMVLTRSRAEAELARMATEIERLDKLVGIWESSKSKKQLHCHLPVDGGKSIIFRNLHYSRGTASVRADHVEIPPGVYALTGANGSGKSTLFRLLMSCSTNEKSTDLPSSIDLLTPMEPLCEDDDIMREVSCVPDDSSDDASDTTENKITDVEINADGSIESSTQRKQQQIHPHPKLSITMPSSSVVEISQTFYWPLYSQPLEWILQEHLDVVNTLSLKDKYIDRVALELDSLDFFQKTITKTVESSSGEESVSTEELGEDVRLSRIRKEIEEIKEDWFSDLSGGQKSKVELVRKVFLREQCPSVLLVDETMAPLDPQSKSLVMSKLKRFCSSSIIIVIYHTDVGQGIDVDGMKQECVPSNDFFDHNLHLEHGILKIKETC